MPELSDRLSDARTAVLYVVMSLVLPRSSAAQAGALHAVYGYGSSAAQVMATRAGAVLCVLWVYGYPGWRRAVCVLWVCGYPGWRRSVCVMGLWLPRLAPFCVCYKSMATQAGAVLCVCVCVCVCYGSMATQAGAVMCIYIVMGLVLPMSMATQAGAVLYIVMGHWLPRLAPCCVYNYGSSATQVCGYPSWRTAAYNYGSVVTQAGAGCIVMRLWLPRSMATQAGAVQHPGGGLSG